MKLQESFTKTILLILLIAFSSSGLKGQTLNFTLSKDTININELLTLTNTSSGFGANARFYWEISSCDFYINDILSICNTITIGATTNLNGKFSHDNRCLITLKAIDSLGNIITSIPFNSHTVYVKLLNPLLCGAVFCHDPLPWNPCEYVCNGNFEFKSSCPTDQDQLCKAEPWQISNCILNGQTWPSSSPDYYNSCSACNPPYPTGSICVGIPYNGNVIGLDDHTPPSGNNAGYAGFIAEGPNHSREYIQQPLKYTLTAGNTYHIEMWLAHDGRSSKACDGIQCYFTNGQPIQPYTWPITNVITSQLSPASGIITSNGWTLYSEDFTVPSGVNNLNWVTIGVFSNNPQTTGVTPDSYFAGSHNQNAYYFIDDISIQYKPTVTATASPATICIGDNSTLTASGAANYFWWAPISLHTNSPVTVNPTATTTYSVTGVSSSGCTGSTTVTVTVNTPQPSFVYSNECLTDVQSFQGSSTCPSSVANWDWNFGDGTSHVSGSGASSVTHDYQNAGNYIVTLTITDLNGNTYYYQQQIVVIAVPVPIVTGPNNSCDSISGYRITNWVSGCTYSYTLTGQPVPISSSLFAVYFPVTNPTYSGNLIVSCTDTISGCLTSDTIHIFSCCSKVGSNIWANDTINTTVIDNVGVAVNGTVIINANVTFNNTVIYMGPEARFDVNPGKTLSINGCTVLAYCDHMWDGMYAESPTAKIEIKNSPFIQDAINGIVSSNGGQLYLYNSTFKNNYYNVIIRNYITIYDHPAYISGCRFIGAEVLPYPPMNPLPTFIGIVIDSVGNENTGGSTNTYATIGDIIAGTTGGSITNSKCNYFRKTGVGIFVKNSNANIYNCYFSGENNTYGTGSAVYIQGKTLSGQQVNNVKHKVNIGGSNPKRIVVDSSYAGVYSDKNIDLKVLYNKFFKNTFGVLYMENNYSGSGNNDSVNISYNTFLTCNYSVYSALNMRCLSNIKYNRINDSTTGANWFSVGIGMYGTQQSNETAFIKYNNITSKGAGIWPLAFFGTLQIDNNFITLPTISYAATAGIKVQNCPGVKIRSNAVITSDMVDTYGISVEQTNSATLQCDSVVGMQYGITFWGANLSTNNSVLQGCSFNACSYGLVKTSNAIIGNQGNRTTSKDNKWYNFTGFTHGYSVSSPVTDTLFVRNGTIYNPNTILNLTGTGLRKYLITPTNSIYKCSTIQQMQLILGGLLVSENNFGLFNAIVDESINYTGNNFEAEYLTKQALFKLIINNPTEFANSFSMADYISSTDNLAMGKLTKAEMLIGNNNLTTAEPLNNAAVPTNQIEESLQMMNNYKMQLLSTGNLSSVQLNNMRTLAAKCPFEYGTAVYMARSVLSKYDLGIIYSNTCELISNIKNKSMLNNNNDNDTSIVNNPIALNSSMIKVSPNPANNKLTIELHLENSDNNCIFELYNINGVRIMQNNLGNGILNSINLFAIPEGTYLYKIINDGNIVETDKLIIVK